VTYFSLCCLSVLPVCAACPQDARNIYVVQELCHGGDLADLMSVSKHAGNCGCRCACLSCT
jgi:hypothetical protein